MRNLKATLILVPLLISCSVQGASEKTRNAASTSTLEAAPAVIYSSDPQEALNQLADADGAIDQSRISEGPCGLVSLTVGPKGLRSYQWVDGAWTYLGGSFETEFPEPYLITTRDFDLDGTKEFMVNFDQNGDGPQTSMYGAILDEDRCNWNWVQITSASGTSKTVRNLFWEDSTSFMSGSIIYDDQEFPVAVYADATGTWWAE